MLRLLGSRASTLFLTPPRAMLEAATYAEAGALARDAGEPGISRQAYALAPKVLELDRLAAGDARLFEVHPELSFRAMAGGHALPESKHSWAGQARRRRLLAAEGIYVPDDIGAAGLAATDDVLDAAAAAWSAARIAGGTACAVPACAEGRQVLGGRRAAIWY